MHTSRRQVFPLVLAFAGVAACSALIDDDPAQCTTDADCASLGATCDVGTSTCVAPTSASGATTATSSATSGTGGGGTGGTTASSTTGQGGGASDPCANPSKPLIAITADFDEDATLGCENDYLVSSDIFVRNQATLTVEKGTHVLGENGAVLVVSPGSALIAVGTVEQPVVFTSALPEGQKAPGDWGGLILLGNAKTNHVDGNGAPTQGDIEGLPVGEGKYGGLDDAESSGSLKYVRIEYGGKLLASGNEVNGLTFGGVGNGTLVDYVEVRQSTDDCFEFFGGTVNAKHLICQHNGDDGIDWDNGYRGKLQFVVVQQDPTVAEDTNGFEGDNDAAASTATPLSAPTIYNATLCGKNVDLDKTQLGLLLRRCTTGHFANLVVTGFESGLDVRDACTRDAFVGGSASLQGSVFSANLIAHLAVDEGVGTAADDDGGFDELAFFLAAGLGNGETGTAAVVDCFGDAPDFAPTAETAIATPVAPPNDGFFDATAVFAGAVKDASDTWAAPSHWAVYGD